MTLRDSELELANHLVAQAGLGVTLTKGSNLWLGEVPAAAADLAVLVRETDGDATMAYIGGAELVEVSVQVVIRGNINARPAAQALARRCFEALHHAELAGYIMIDGEQTPASMGADGNGRPQYAFNLRCMYQA